MLLNLRNKRRAFMVLDGDGLIDGGQHTFRESNVDDRAVYRGQVSKELRVLRCVHHHPLARRASMVFEVTVRLPSLSVLDVSQVLALLPARSGLVSRAGRRYRKPMVSSGGSPKTSI